MPNIEKIFSFLFVFLQTEISSSQPVAQKTFPPAYEIKTDTVLLDTLPNVYWQMLEDKDDKLSFEEVITSPVSEKFHYDSAKKINFHVSNYWFRFSLKNISGHQLQIGFYEDFKAISDWYFILPDGKIIHKTSGQQTPWSKNESLTLPDYFMPGNFLSLSLAPEQVILFYNRVHYDYFQFIKPYPQQFFIRYGSTNKIILENYVANTSYYFNTIHSSFFFGIMVLAALLNFFFYLIVRERKFLYFSLYTFFLGLGRFFIDGQFYNIFLHEYPRFYEYFLDFFWPVQTIFFPIFLRSILNIKKYYPVWDRLISFLIYFNLLLGISSNFIDYFLRGTPFWGIGSTAWFTFIQINNFSLLVTLFLFLKHSVFFDKRFLYAILPSFAIWVLGFALFNYLQELGIWVHFQASKYQYFSPDSWHIVESVCLIWQVLCFSWLLFHRFVELKQQVIRKELEQDQLIARQAELEMQALRAQMNPHFIFNSLNSINRFILQNNRTQASEYLTKFSKLVRMILQNSQASLISLDNELEALNLYLDLEAVRFDHRFDYKISVPEDLDTEVLKVPPLIIQPYTENAIWHGLMHKEEKGQLDIEVSQEDDHLFFKITDNGIGRKRAEELAGKSATKHKSMGLRITKERIAMLQKSNGTESPVKIIDLVNPDGTAAGTEIIIKMPLIYD